MSGKDDIHFTITADDQASQVLSQFQENVDKAVGGVVTIGNQLEQFDVNLGGALETVETFQTVVANPTPLAMLTAGLTLAGAAYLALKNYVAEANQEFDNWNKSVGSFKDSWEQVAALRMSNDLLGVDPYQRAKIDFAARVSARPMPGLSEDERSDRAHYQEVLRRPYLDPQLEDDAKKRVKELNEKEKALREAETQNRRITLEQYAEQIDRQRTLNEEKQRQIEAEKQSRAETEKKRNAERDYLDMLERISKQAERDAKARERDRAQQRRSRAESITESLMTPKERADRDAMELGIMAMFGDISPETFRRGMQRINGAQKNVPADALPGYRSSAAIESRTLTRGPGSTFNPEHIWKRTADATEKAARENEKQSAKMERQVQATERLSNAFGKIILVN